MELSARLISPSVTERDILGSSPSASENEDPLPASGSEAAPPGPDAGSRPALLLDLLKVLKSLWLLQVSKLLEEGDVVRLSRES